MSPVSTRLRWVLGLTVLTHAGLVYLFYQSVALEGAGHAWTLWRLAGAAVLLPAAFDLVLLVVWAGLSCRLLRAEDRVAEEWDQSGREALEDFQQGGGQCALLWPLHCEADTDEDAAALRDRLVDLVVKTPTCVKVHLLFDSPAEPGRVARERAVFEQVRGALPAADAGRVFLQEYRAKPAGYSGKTGSIRLWLERHGPGYKYFGALDADSSLPDEDAGRPETVKVYHRMIAAMERAQSEGRPLSLIQASIGIRPAGPGECRSVWGAYQEANAALGRRYLGKALLGWLIAGQAPSYGHNNLFRTEDFVRHNEAGHHFLSHDYIDAAELISAGCRCVYSSNVLTYEEPESTLLQWSKRDLRWARGNNGWIGYLLTKESLPGGPWFYFTTGLLAYLLPLVATVFLIVSVFLAGQGVALLGDERPEAAWLLVGLVSAALFVPRWVGSASWREFAAATLPGLALTPALSVYSGIFFILGGFSSAWNVRASRSAALTAEDCLATGRLCLIPSLLGVLLWQQLYATPGGDGSWMLQATALAMAVSPVTAVLFSLPSRRVGGWFREGPGVQGQLQPSPRGP